MTNTKNLPTAPKKRYQTPQLTQWGSVVDLTHGLAADPGDGFGTGTRGV